LLWGGGDGGNELVRFWPPLQPALPERLRLLRRRVRAPALGRRLVDLLALRRHDVVGELEVEELHLLDLVAQAAGLLELEVAGGLAHAALEVLERGLEIRADEGAGVFLDAERDQDAVLLIGAVSIPAPVAPP